MEYAEYVNPVGTSGGLDLGWSGDVRVQSLSNERNILDIAISGTLFRREFKASGIYGNPDYARRMINLENRKRIGVLMGEPWICVRDFNDILHHREKKKAGDLKINTR